MNNLRLAREHDQAVKVGPYQIVDLKISAS